MAKTFTYRGDLADALDYARFRLDDIDATVSQDETGAPSPFLWDETYSALFARFGVQEGMAQAAGAIATRLAKEISSFGESPGIRFSLRNITYYEELADIIRAEPPFDASDILSGGKCGLISAGAKDLATRNEAAGSFPLHRYREIMGLCE